MQGLDMCSLEGCWDVSVVLLEIGDNLVNA